MSSISFSNFVRATACVIRRSLPAAAFAALALAGSVVSAQSTWPTRPIRLVVAYPPGGLADVMARLLQPQLSEALGQPVVIDNRSGANGNVAAVEVIRNGRDDHTFLLSSTAVESVNQFMFERMPFDPAKDLRHVALVANSQLFLVTRPTLPPNSLKELVAFARTKSERLSYGSAGPGSTPHLAGELFKQYAGIDATHVPYRGLAPAIQDVMAGQIDFTFAPGTVFSSIKAGKLKLLAVASRQRTPNYPSAPTFAEEGFGKVYADSLFGIYAPAAIPAAAVERLNREVNRLLASPTIKARFAEMGADAAPVTPAEFKAMVQTEMQLFGAIVKTNHITAE